VAEAISNGDQCLCLIKYDKSFGVVLVLAWLPGFDTLAQYAIRS
jgi:hypothetical protein